jgi:hypothetical protein
MASQRVRADHPQEPQDQQDYKYCPKHGKLPPLKQRSSAANQLGCKTLRHDSTAREEYRTTFVSRIRRKL